MRLSCTASSPLHTALPTGAQASDSAIFIRKGTATILKGEKEVAKRSKGDLIGEVRRNVTTSSGAHRATAFAILALAPLLAFALVAVDIAHLLTTPPLRFLV